MQLEQANERKVYYCETHSPWQKGSNENVNGRLRWHLPKEADIAKITQEELDKLAAYSSIKMISHLELKSAQLRIT